MSEDNSSPIFPIIQSAYDIPETLYHYTSSAGLIGIIESGKIWATKATYLNDSSELELAIEYIREEIAIQKKDNNKQSIFGYDDMLSALNGIEKSNVSVISFSTHGDLLSQWRGYSKIGDGYSIGFDGQKLKEHVEHLATGFGEKFYLVPCQYEAEVHKKLVTNLVNDSIKDNSPFRGLPEHDSNDLSAKFHYFIQNVLEIGQIIKSKAFKEEQEWRLISPSLSYSNAKFRIGKHSLIPYWEIDLDIVSTLKSIIVGPTPTPSLSNLAVYGIITKQEKLSAYPYSDPIPGINKITIENSKIPYRDV